MFKIRFLLVLAMVCPSAAMAARHEIDVPLVDGKLSTAELSRRVAGDLHLSADILGGFDATLDIRGVSGWLALRGLNSAMGDAFQITVKNDALVISVDPEKLPKDWNDTAGAVRRFTEITAPDATARQNRHLGLLLPRVVDPAKPLAILIHGIDGDAGDCDDLRDCLIADGRQAATFAYPGEQPLADSAVLLARNIAALRETFPSIKIDIIAESMGGLIARKYVEGPQYAGGVDHLILIAPPNEGSGWTSLALLEKIRANYIDWRTDKDWGPTWMITQGMGEAGGDLKPGSKFLTELNAQPRRAGVKYTIIAGDQPIYYRVEAEMLEGSANLIPGIVADVWGVRQTREALEHKADKLRAKTGTSDGPVKVSQARLGGVDDFVELPADHLALYRTRDGQPPAAWAVVRERLGEE